VSQNDAQVNTNGTNGLLEEEKEQRIDDLKKRLQVQFEEQLDEIHRSYEIRRHNDPLRSFQNYQDEM
jgi:hypothetical protein